ncbi:MAG: serine protein kinase [Bacteroidetes bacterium GWF2_43_63]|nr:MAG: serine protein kinase [Bacteroidetes bacterium GWE2_42_42]OFY53763.1 MAG: serine protein kinase [Bacteroidetes bacterium GWF2_43_63]HCB61047.1 serine protein kinase [Bacteroidales bacterium]HCY24169.1 serine protein kinase [Bacteroidales bacterium]
MAKKTSAEQLDVNPASLDAHILKVISGERAFENVFQSVSRMILDGPDKVEKVTINGKPTYDFKLFRDGKKHIVGMYDEINSFVSFVKDAAEGGSSAEMAFVLIGEPGNGKTFFVDFLSTKYREFISNPANLRYTFRFNNVDLTGRYGKIDRIESQTYEDPMVLAMNLFESRDDNKKYLSKLGYSDSQLEKLFRAYRPLGACTYFVYNQLKDYFGGDMAEILKHIEIVPVPVSESRGTLTGKYAAKDKITSSSVDLLGDESISRLLHLADADNPYRFDLRRGALARVAGGGIHFADEIFKNKRDLVQVYLGVIQNRSIEIEGFKWPLDTLIVATSNNAEFARFQEEKEQAPIIDRCRLTYMSHNTNLHLQKLLTSYSLGGVEKTNFVGKKLHIDPNLNQAISTAFILTRMPGNEKLNPVEMMKLAAGEVAGEKSMRTLAEVVNELNSDPDITRRFGQKGLGHRNLGRAIQILLEQSDTQEGECMYAYDVFSAIDKVIIDYVQDQNDRIKFMNDVKIARKLYRENVMTAIFNAYMNEANAIEKDVMNYVNMIIGIDAKNLGPNKIWTYQDPQSKKLISIKIDESYINSVEDRLGLKSEEQKQSFRTTIAKIYGQKMNTDPNYNFMDNNDLVKAVTDVRLKSDIAGAGSLVGALSNRNNDENNRLYNRMIDTMINVLGYCHTCAEKTIEYFCTQDDTN